MSNKHLDRYVREFAGRHNLREANTLEQMACISKGLLGKRLQYQELTAPNGLPSSARLLRKGYIKKDSLGMVRAMV